MIALVISISMSLMAWLGFNLGHYLAKWIIGFKPYGEPQTLGNSPELETKRIYHRGLFRGLIIATSTSMFLSSATLTGNTQTIVVSSLYGLLIGIIIAGRLTMDRI